MSQTIFALFDTQAQAGLAMEKLQGGDLTSPEITVFSTQPCAGSFLSHEGTKISLFRYALVGGVLGLFAGYFLPTGTANIMDLPVGGQPIISLWAFGVVIFELTALGVITGTVLGFLVETGLPHLSNNQYGEEAAKGLAQDKLLIRIAECPADEVGKIISLVEGSGATVVEEPL